MIETEKPGTPSELIHFGVLGMKWGVRRTQGTREFHQKFPTRRERAREIHRARADLQKARTNRAYAAKGEHGKLKAEYLKNPDRATAKRLTSGEKVALALLHVAGAPLVAPITVGVVGRRRYIETKQGKG